MPWDIAVDEAMIPFKGRISFRQVCIESKILCECVSTGLSACVQYIKSKSHKYGIKVFVLSSSSNGYVYVGERVSFLFKISGLSIAMLQGRILVLMTWLLLMMMILVWQMMMMMTVMKMMMVNEFYISVTGLMELKIMIL